MASELLDSIQSNEARLKFRDLLDDIMSGSHVAVTRYHRIEAVVVPGDWYDQAATLMAQEAERAA